MSDLQTFRDQLAKVKTIISRRLTDDPGSHTWNFIREGVKYMDNVTAGATRLPTAEQIDDSWMGYNLSKNLPHEEEGDPDINEVFTLVNNFDLLEQIPTNMLGGIAAP